MPKKTIVSDDILLSDDDTKVVAVSLNKKSRIGKKGKIFARIPISYNLYKC